MSSITFNPGKMIGMLIKSNRETKRLVRPITVNETVLRELEDKYRIDRDKLTEIGLIPSQADTETARAGVA
jgi:hypothetical protein